MITNKGVLKVLFEIIFVFHCVYNHLHLILSVYNYNYYKIGNKANDKLKFKRYWEP